MGYYLILFSEIHEVSLTQLCLHKYKLHFFEILTIEYSFCLTLSIAFAMVQQYRLSPILFEEYYKTLRKANF